MNENEILKQCEEITKKIEAFLDMDSNDPKIQILDELLKQEFDEIYKLISTSEKLAINFFSNIKNEYLFG